MGAIRDDIRTVGKTVLHAAAPSERPAAGRTDASPIAGHAGERGGGHTPARKRRQHFASPLASGIASLLLSLMPALLVSDALAPESLAAALIVGAATSIALNVSCPTDEDRRRTAPVVICVAAVCMVVVLAIPDVRGGIYAIYNLVASRYDDVFGAYLSLVGTGQLSCSSILFAICFGGLNGLVAQTLSRLKTSGMLLLVVTFTCAGAMRLHTGLVPIGAALGITGWISQCRYVQLSGSSFSIGPWAFETAISGIGFVVVFVTCNLLYTPAAIVDDIHDTFVKTSYEVRYGHDNLPDGNLMQASSMNDEDESGLVLFVDGTVSDDLLLKGFIGANFDGRSWEKLPHTSYEGAWFGMIDWLADSDFTPALQRSIYDDESAAAIQSKQPNVTTVSVNAENAYKGYVYVPYTLRSLEGTNAKLNLGGTVLAGFVGTRTYRFTMDDVAPNQVITNPSWLSAESGSYIDAENVFSGFVRENNLAVPAEEQDAVKQLIFNDETWNAEADTSEYAVISRVRTMLSTLASYTETPARPPEDGSFTEWFLADARQGNSAYFATVAALALRTQDIPARYVEGYRASASDLAETSSSNSQLTLDGHDTHAWIEVYLKGQGWTPIEVTPGFYTQAISADEIIDVNEAHARGDDSPLEAGSIAGNAGDDQSAEEGESSSAETGVRIAAHLACYLAIVLASACIIAFGQRAWRRYRRRTACASDDQTVSLPALYRNLAALMAEGIPAFDETRPLDSAQAFPSTFTGIDEKEYRRAITLHQAFAFGGRNLTPAELRTVRAFDSRLAGALPQADTVRNELRRYFVKAF